MELTELGWRQSREVAAGWTETPNLIVTSPYLRTQQTEAATIERFSNVPVEVWPIEEFTYLQPSKWNGTLSSERMPHIERYWAEADPVYCDGEGAESFSALLGRAQAALDRLAALPEYAWVYVFSHGQFIQGIRSLVIDGELSNREKMRKFWGRKPGYRQRRVGGAFRRGWRMATCSSRSLYRVSSTTVGGLAGARALSTTAQLTRVIPLHADSRP